MTTRARTPGPPHRWWGKGVPLVAIEGVQLLHHADVREFDGVVFAAAQQLMSDPRIPLHLKPKATDSDTQATATPPPGHRAALLPPPPV